MPNDLHANFMQILLMISGFVDELVFGDLQLLTWWIVDQL
jgi:hypothetical protein